MLVWNNLAQIKKKYGMILLVLSIVSVVLGAVLRWHWASNVIVDIALGCREPVVFAVVQTA